MTLNVGSMLVKAKFEAGNMMSGLGAMNSRFKESQLAAKHATTEFRRMKGSLMAMGASALLTSGSLLRMLMNAIMESPFLSAAMEKLKNQMMLFGNAIARHLAPILEKVVDFVKWLREGFQSLPEPIQAAIVKFIAIGIIIIGLISTLGILGVALGGIKTGLLALIPASILTKLGTFATAISGGTIAAAFLSIGLGLVAGGLAVLALDKFGVIAWFEDLGSKAFTANEKIRDLLITLGTPAAVIGGGILDITRGDLGLTRAKQARQMGEEAKWRYNQGVSEHYSSGGTWTESSKPKTEIAAQNNYFDFSGLTNGTPEELIEATNLFTETLAENQEKLNP